MRAAILIAWYFAVYTSAPAVIGPFASESACETERRQTAAWNVSKMCWEGPTR